MTELLGTGLLAWAGRWARKRTDGYRATADVNAAASWANTPSGQIAFALDRAGSLNRLAQCDGQGWRFVQNGRRSCYPHATVDGKVYGWTLP